MMSTLVVVLTVAFGQTASVTPSATFTGGTDFPARLAPAPGGGVYVTDTLGGQVVEYDALGDVANTYPIPEGPVGIAVHSSGNVFISRLDGAVAVYDAAFTYLDSADPAPFTLTTPNDIAIHPTTGEVYVTDSDAHRVLVFSGTTFALARAWGSEGSGLGQFQSPQAIAIDTLSDPDRVIVTDVDNFRVQVFDTAGVVLFKFGYRTLYTGSEELAWFARGEGLALDSCGNIYLTDALMGTVRAFRPAGTEISPTFTPLVSYGTGAGQVRLPCDVIIDATGTMYVASQGNSAIEVYDVTCTGGMPAGRVGRGGIAGSVVGGAGEVSNDPQVEGLRNEPPDNPMVIVEAMHNGTYDRKLDLNHDRRVDNLDLEIAVDGFGAATVEDFLNAWNGLRDYPAPLQPPHMIDISYTCGRCHSMDGAPGGMESAAGQENLCRSCHMAGGRAMSTMMGPVALVDTHPWGMPADSGGVMGPDPDSEVGLHLDGDNVRCGTCHDPHDSDAGEPYLRAPVQQAQLCGACHAEAAEWQHAGHADELADPWSHYDWTQSSRAACRKCHSGNGFIDFSNGLPDAQQSGAFRVLDCAVCHAAHSRPQDEDLLRIYDDVTLPGDADFTDQGPDATCMTCHNGRRAPGEASTPHYALGGVMLEGINAIDFGAVSPPAPVP